MQAKFFLISDDGLVPITMSFVDQADKSEPPQIIISTSASYGSGMENSALRFIEELEKVIKEGDIAHKALQREGGGWGGSGRRTIQLQINLKSEFVV